VASWRPRGRLVQLCHFWRECFATGTWRLRSLGVHLGVHASIGPSNALAVIARESNGMRREALHEESARAHRRVLPNMGL